MHQDNQTAASGAPAKAARSFGKLICPECGESFTATHHRQSFCSVEHRGRYHARAQVAGQLLVTLGKAWRGGRDLGRAKNPTAERVALIQTRDWAFQELCKVLDDLNAADREGGRPNAIRLLARQRAMNAKPDHALHYEKARARRRKLRLRMIKRAAAGPRRSMAAELARSSRLRRAAPVAPSPRP